MFRVKCAPGYEFQPGGCVPVVHIDFMERRPDSVPVGYYVQANGRTATKDGYDYAESWTVAQISQDTSLWGRVIDTAIVGLATAVNPVAGGIAKLVIASNNAPGPRPIRTAVPVPKPRARISAALAAYYRSLYVRRIRDAHRRQQYFVRRGSNPAKRLQDLGPLSFSQRPRRAS